MFFLRNSGAASMSVRKESAVAPVGSEGKEHSLG
jgi:hypothetical protein